jgi:hypothetical protein
MLHLELMAWDNTKGRFLICICQTAFAAMNGEYLAIVIIRFYCSTTFYFIYLGFDDSGKGNTNINDVSSLSIYTS